MATPAPPAGWSQRDHPYQQLGDAPGVPRERIRLLRELLKGSYGGGVRLMLDRLPPSLEPQREALTRCLEAMDRALPLRSVYLFGSHVRGEARRDSDVDLCLVADGAGEQRKAAQRYREAIWHVWPCPALTLVPISPGRLREKLARGDPFYATVIREGVEIAA